MAGYELNIREPGKQPRLVALTQSLVVGRSRRADVTVEDQEVGREQFRIGVDRGIVVLEGIGKTNRTMVDGSVLDAGARITLSPGATIMVGKTTFVLQNEELTARAIRPPQDADATAVRAPDKPPAAPVAAAGPVEPGPPREEKTGTAVGPMQTMQMPRPGGRGPVAGPAAVPQKPAGPSQPPADQGPIEQTMQWKGGFRPGAASPLPPTVPPAGPPAPPKQGPAAPPAQSPSKPAPAPTPARAEAGAGAAGAQAPRKQDGTTTPSSPPPGSSARLPDKPVTVALSQTDIVPAGFPSTSAINPLELETRLHDALPRLFVKSDTMKRRIRLLKTRCTVGRGEGSDVLLPVESVSETHAEITFDGTRFVLRDCGSRNGTYVDGNHLRSTQHPLARHSLIGAGTLRAIFLCNTKDGGRSDRKCEERALRLLVGAGRLTRDEAQQILRMASTDSSQSIAEIVLMETALAPTDWVTAIAGARNKVTLWDRIRRVIGRSSPPKPS